jgi:hypothetical protein
MLRRPPKRRERRYRAQTIDRAAHGQRAIALFNAGRFWDAHEELETIWRSVANEGEAVVIQGLIQAAAALLHQERGNTHGARVVGGAALEKLSGSQHPAVEFETVAFWRALDRALLRDGPPPNLQLRQG